LTYNLLTIASLRIGVSCFLVKCQKALLRLIKLTIFLIYCYFKGAEADTYIASYSLQVLDDGLTSAGNATMTYMNIQSLGVKGLVKKTAKDTGKQLGKAVLEAHATGGSNEKKT